MEAEAQDFEENVYADDFNVKLLRMLRIEGNDLHNRTAKGSFKEMIASDGIGERTLAGLKIL